MKKQYLEAAILSVVYLVFAGLLLQNFQFSSGPFKIITYPAKLCLAPILENDYDLQKINLSLFGLYFLWSFNCVYLSTIKTIIKMFSWKSMSKISQR